MPANDSSSPDTPDAYAADETATDAQSHDAPVTITDLKSEPAQDSSSEPATPAREYDTNSAAGTAQSATATASQSTDAEPSSPSRDLDAIKAEILKGIGRHGDRHWSRLGSYQLPWNGFGYLLKVHLDDTTWFCVVEQQRHGLTTRYTVRDLGTRLVVEPIVPDVETVAAAVNAQRAEDLGTDQSAAVAPLSDQQRQQLTWEYAQLTLRAFQESRVKAERRTTATEFTMYERFVLLPDYEAQLRSALADDLSPRQLDVVLDAMWDAFDANPAVPHQLLEQTTTQAPLIGKLILE